MANIYYIFLFTFLFSKKTLQYIVLHFRTNIDLNKLNEDNYMNTTMNQQLYVDFNIGDSHQTIPMTLKTQQHPTYIVSSRSLDEIAIKYNEKKSHKSFHNITNYLISQLYKYDFKEGYLVNDSITFNSSLIFNNFTYMLATKINICAKNVSGEIGFSQKKEDEYLYFYPEKSNFLKQLKENNLIYNKIFGIVYDTEYEGRLFLGSYLHQVDHLYSENELNTNYIKNYIADKNRDKWLINFNVKCLSHPDNTEIYIEYDTYGLVMYEIGLIVGSRTFREKFVIDYFNAKKCVESKITSKPFCFYQYSCDYEEQFSDFPDIIMALPGKYSFNFTKNELFKKVGKKYIFQIVFEIIDLDINYWRLGQAFFRKYNSFFTSDEKESLFSYYPMKKVSPKTDWIISGQFIVIIILSLILFALLGVIIYFLCYCEKKRRKRIAQELKEDDNYDYSPANDDQEARNNLIINH